VLICVLWLGYFVLEGFDFGVGMLHALRRAHQAERRACLHSIGPVWDGNEVWLLVAGGATFAAFPQWYATLFSGFYLALFLILVALIVRNVGLRVLGKGDSEQMAHALGVGDHRPAASCRRCCGAWRWANIVHGVPIDAHGEYTGTLFTLLKPYALLGGLATLDALPRPRAIFLSLRTTAASSSARGRSPRAVAPLAAALVIAFLAGRCSTRTGSRPVSRSAPRARRSSSSAAAALAGAGRRRAFAATCGVIVLFFVALFATSSRTRWSRPPTRVQPHLNEAAPSRYTLSVMTVVAVLLVPFVLLYQGWTYWVFRHRVSAEDFGEVRSPLDLLPGPGQEHGVGARRRLRRPRAAPGARRSAARAGQPRCSGAPGGDGRARPRVDGARRRAGDALAHVVARVFLGGAAVPTSRHRCGGWRR
jgi:cytochrome d ubiquinol oxidase subunit II